MLQPDVAIAKASLLALQLSPFETPKAFLDFVLAYKKQWTVASVTLFCENLMFIHIAYPHWFTNLNVIAVSVMEWSRYQIVPETKIFPFLMQEAGSFEQHKLLTHMCQMSKFKNMAQEWHALIETYLARIPRIDSLKAAFLLAHIRLILANIPNINANHYMQPIDALLDNAMQLYMHCVLILSGTTSTSTAVLKLLNTHCSEVQAPNDLIPVMAQLFAMVVAESNTNTLPSLILSLGKHWSTHGPLIVAMTSDNVYRHFIRSIGIDLLVDEMQEWFWKYLQYMKESELHHLVTLLKTKLNKPEMAKRFSRISKATLNTMFWTIPCCTFTDTCLLLQ